MGVDLVAAKSLFLEMQTTSSVAGSPLKKQIKSPGTSHQVDLG